MCLSIAIAHYIFTVINNLNQQSGRKSSSCLPVIDIAPVIFIVAATYKHSDILILNR